MPRITFRITGADNRVVEAEAGLTIMQVAVNAGIPGIIGECGGDMSCATCHVYLEDQTRFKRRSADEEDLLELADRVRPVSRLSCQLKLTDSITEVELEVPQS